MGKVNTSGPRAVQQMVITPGGFRALSNVHLIEPGYHVSGKNGTLLKIHTASGQVVRELGPINADEAGTRKALRAPRQSPAPQPISDQWIVYAGWMNETGHPITYLATGWQVPPPPASQDNQLI